jgi:cysteine-rich repeat protein
VLPDGRFVNAWQTRFTGWVNVVSLCTAGSAVCGDGVLSPRCERCDDGPANSDTAPDACRTDCLPAHCGDGVTDAGEECDDGNPDLCDGCSPDCRIEPAIVCGDGAQSRVCGEQCDDTNGALLDGCTASCQLERIPGGGTPSTDCLSEWSISNTTNVPPYDKHGAINATQTCADDDPGCDFDGGTPGSCTFRLRACANNTSSAKCSVPSRLSAWAVVRPSEKQALERPELAAVRAALAGVPGAIVGPTTRDVCSGDLSVTVPLRGVPGDYKAAKLKLSTRATAYDATVDKDKLTLVCTPAP